MNGFRPLLGAAVVFTLAALSQHRPLLRINKAKPTTS